MMVFLIINMAMMVNCLNPVLRNGIDDDVKAIMGKYLSKIPDMKPRYVLNDKLSSVINHYFKGKISTLPLYKISLKIDRNPVKIPWTLNTLDEAQNDIVLQDVQSSEQQDSNETVKHYKVVKSHNLGSTKKPDTTAKASKRAKASTTQPPFIEIQ